MKFIPHLVWLVGALVLLIAFGRYSGASMPYQDPTPELLAVQRGQIESEKTMALIGGLIFIGGVVWVIFRRRSRFVGVDDMTVPNSKRSFERRAPGGAKESRREGE